jgi:hypothetical protein
MGGCPEWGCTDLRGYGITGICTAKSGILKDFVEKKAKDAKKDEIPWGILYAKPFRRWQDTIRGMEG